MSASGSAFRISGIRETSVNTAFFSFIRTCLLRSAVQPRSRRAEIQRGLCPKLLPWAVMGVFAFAGAFPAHAAPIQIADSQAYVHADGALLEILDSSASGYTENFDGEGYGSYGWTYVNTTGSTLTDLTILVFLDADIDRDENTFFNEYGEFVALTLPPFAPVGTIAATAWEIDEPGFLYGDIVLNIWAGFLDNSNGVDSSFPDDVSLALQFFIGALDPGLAATVTLQISPTNINGLRQVDPDSDLSFYFNGFASVDFAPPPGGEIPEPATWMLVLICLAVVTCIRAKKAKIYISTVSIGILFPSLVAGQANYVYTTTSDFSEGSIVNLNLSTPDQLQINPPAGTESFPFITISASGRGTLVRVETRTGQVIGEYRSSPLGRPANPSRTTVDFFGNVWAGNRDESVGG